VEKAKQYARIINPKLEFIELSAKSGAGMDQWVNWLLALRA
jgi:hydrogenase nickel incorporation protein HypB